MLIRFIIIIACVIWTINCCVYNGKKYKVGDTYSTDGCQTCTCGQYGRVKCVSREPCGPDFLKCKFGRYFKDLGQKPSCNPLAQVSCPTGFVCSGGPADEPGFCCKATNPCRVGQPKNKNGDAIPCIHQPNRCGNGYICVGSATSSSACCEGCTLKSGRTLFLKDTFIKPGGIVCTCVKNGRIVCKKPKPPKDFLKCEFGRYFKDLGKKPSCNPFAQSCPKGFFCSSGPADEPGFCCKSKNPCRVGKPKSYFGDAIPCINHPKICGKRYICVGSATSSSACCKGCTLKSGRTLFLKDTFIQPDGRVCTCVKNGRIVCKKPKGCDFFGQFFKPGESFPARDGCNTCRCSNNGLVLCTKKACIGVCSFRGMVFQSGDSFPAGDNCNTCTCNNGQVGCTEKACPPGQPCKPGESFFDGCNTCSCQSDGNLICTLRFCQPCKVKGKLIKTGDSFPAGDGCNTCKCDDGKILCTRISCRKG